MECITRLFPNPDLQEITFQNGVYIRLVNQAGYEWSKFSKDYGIHLSCSEDGWELEIGFGARVLRIGRDV